MRALRTFAACVVLIAFTGISEGKEWRGIVPLHSTRKDVTKILGTSEVTDNRRAIYNLKDEVVLIDYSAGTCEHGGIWNVPRDTVLAISVTPRSALEISDLSLNLGRYQVVADEHLAGIYYYNNPEEGIHITTDGETVRSIDYLPTSQDEYLRCAKPPAHLITKDGRTVDSHTLFDSYGELSFSREKQHLDLFGRRLRDLVGSRGYIVVYTGPGMNIQMALSRANRAKAYLRRNYAIKENSIEILKGSRRRELMIELYIDPPAGQKPH